MASLAVPSGSRLEPSADLPAEAAEVFRTVVEALPPNWFKPEHRALIEAFAVHSANARYLATQIDVARANNEPIAVVAQLMRLHSSQTARLSSLSTKLRLSPQANQRAQQAQNSRAAHVPGPKPWEGWQTRLDRS
jgi:hypothetical protein